MFGMEEDSLKALNRIYAKIIERYREYIEEKEQKTVYELKAMIVPDDSSIEEITSRLKKCESIKDFLSELIEFSKNIKIIYSPVQFWLTFQDIVEIGACEPFQKAIFLCAVVLNFTEKAYVVKIQEDIYTVFEHMGSCITLDVKSDSFKEIDSLDEFLKKSQFYFNNSVFIENELNELE